MMEGALQSARESTAKLVAWARAHPAAAAGIVAVVAVLAYLASRQRLPEGVTPAEEAAELPESFTGEVGAGREEITPLNPAEYGVVGETQYPYAPALPQYQYSLPTSWSPFTEIVYPVQSLYTSPIHESPLWRLPTFPRGMQQAATPYGPYSATRIQTRTSNTSRQLITSVPRGMRLAETPQAIDIRPKTKPAARPSIQRPRGMAEF